MGDSSTDDGSAGWTDPKTLLMLAGLGSGAISGILQNKQQQQQLALQQQQLANQKQLGEDQIAASKSNAAESTALNESEQDPFRGQMAQAGDLSKLDQLERASFTPVTLQADPKYAASVPKMSGGFSYAKSPELVAAAAALKRNVLGGNVTPTMTDPANYGKTSALNLVGIQNDGVDPATVNAARAPGATATPGTPATAASTDPGAASYMTGYAQRGGTSGGSAIGGAAKGAMSGASLGSVVPGVGTAIGAGAGALIGALGGALNKHAASAPTDYSVNDATTILTNAIRQQFGRDPNPGEVQQMLAGQGLKPGDRWVGSSGLSSVVSAIMQQGRQAQTSAPTPSYSAVG